MLDRIIDKYFMKKLAITLINRAKALRCLDFSCIPLKDKLEIYVNYAEPKKRLYDPRRVCSINRNDVFYAIANFNDYSKIFQERVEDVLKEN